MDKHEALKQYIEANGSVGEAVITTSVDTALDYPRPVKLGAIADEMQRLKRLKEALKLCTDAVQQHLDTLDERLYETMIEEEFQNFNRAGFTYYLSNKRYVRARGGVNDPNLIQWLEQHDHADVAAKKINAQTLRSVVSAIMDDNDGVCPTDLADLVIIDETPTVGIRKS